MAWFKKKKESDDIIPELPSLLEGDESLSQDAEQISAEGAPQEEMYSAEEIPEPVLQELEKESENQHPAIEESRFEQERKPKEYQKKQIPETQFVRLDKFESAYASISNIKKKIEDMNRFLKDIRQLNAKEDAELSAWEKEINEIKLKIENIDRSLFENLE